MRSIISFLFLAGLVGLVSVGAASAQNSAEPIVVRWEKNATLAFNKGIQEKKPVVLVYVCPLIQDKCIHCKRFRASLFSDDFNALADKAVFALCELDVRSLNKIAPSGGMKDGKKTGSMGWDIKDADQYLKPADEPAAALFKLLKGTGTPMVTILEPNPKYIVEIARLNGYFEARPLRDHIDHIVTKWKENGGKITPPPQAQK